MRSTIAIIAVLLAAAAVAQPTSKYIRHQPGNRRVIVFVNGIFGDWKSTWENADHFYWPEALTHDHAFDGADVYVHSFNSPKLAKAQDIANLAARFGDFLQTDHVLTDHDQVIFLCHSMGGLVVERLILRHQELAPKVKFLFFASTPQEGAQIAALGHIFNGDPQLQEMFPGDENNFLEGLDTGWRDAHLSIPVYCIVERAKTHGISVVNRYSGTRICKTVTPIDQNHIEIVKPSSTNDDSYVAFWNAYKANPVLQTTTVAREWTSWQAVDCDHTNNQTLTASVPLDKDTEKVNGTPSASLRDPVHIRNASATIVSSSDNTAQVHFNFDGEAKNFVGNCPGGGHVTVVVTFQILKSVPVQ